MSLLTDKEDLIFFGRPVVEEVKATDLKVGDRFKTKQGGSHRETNLVIEQKDSATFSVRNSTARGLSDVTREMQVEDTDTTVFRTKRRWGSRK